MKCNWFQNTFIQTTAWSNQIVRVIIHCCSHCNCYHPCYCCHHNHLHTSSNCHMTIWHIIRLNTFNLECSVFGNKSFNTFILSTDFAIHFANTICYVIAWYSCHSNILSQWGWNSRIRTVLSYSCFRWCTSSSVLHFLDGGPL